MILCYLIFQLNIFISVFVHVFLDMVAGWVCMEFYDDDSDAGS